MSTETDNAAVEIVPLSAIHAMERAQIDTQVATAHQYPREIEKFKKRSLAMATLDMETAESCVYCRPVGKEKNTRGEWVQKFAEGPSIRLAEIVACCYGNIRAASRVVEQTPRMVKAEGACHDLETNYAGKSDCVEATVDKQGNPYSERQCALIAKVACAKAYRDAIFRVVPRALCKPAFEAAKKVIAGEGKSIADRVKRVQSWAAQRKIEEKRILATLGITDWAEVTEDHLMTLTGLKTAVQDGDPIDEVFPPIEGSQQAASHTPALTPQQRMEQSAANGQDSAAATGTPTTTAAAAQPKSAAEQVKDVQAKRRGPGRPPKVEKFTPKEAAELRAKGESVAETAIAYPEGKSAKDYDAAGNPLPVEAPATEPAKTEEADLAAMGLAPEETKVTPPAETTPPPPPPPTVEPKTFKVLAGEDPLKAAGRAIQYIEEFATRDGVTEDQIISFCRTNKIAQPNQKLGDLKTDKLFSICMNWKVLAPKFQAIKA